ncbi:MAG: hypothetical protein KBD94_09715 [Pyrinomonadaceae bacterium]|nr:hypothetical protein [Pyrinomonadaceae bacterium]
MTPEFNTVLNAAMQLAPADRLKLVSRLSIVTSRGKKAGAVEKYFGMFNSGDPNSADNDKIDADLAKEYLATHEPEN